MSFWNALEALGSRIAFCDQNGASLRYDELARAGNLYGDIADRSLLLLSLDNSLSSMVAYVGALRRGLPSMIINDGNEETAARLIRTFKPHARWSPEKGLQRLKGEQTLTPHPDLCILLSTSGSSGSTKLVRLSADAVNANACSIVKSLGISGNDRAITTLPPGYSYGLSVINSHLAAGATIVLYDGSVIEPRFRTLVDAQQVTSIAGVPHTYELLDRSGFLDRLPPTVHTLTQAGGRLPPDRVEKIADRAKRNGARLFVMYGQTEATARMACLAPEELDDHSDCVGRPIPGGHFDVVDPLTGAPISGEGELVYSGPNIMMGYAAAPSDLARGPELECLRTGDLGERLACGIYRISGRINRLAKLFGLRIDLDHVEEFLREEGIEAVAAAGEDLVVVAVSDPSEVARANELLSRRIAIPAACRIVVRLETIPRLQSGKIDYETIVQLADTARASERVRSNDMLARFRGDLARALGREHIEPWHSLTSLGADSLAYVQASILVEDLLGDLPADWEDLTISEIETRAMARATPASGTWRSVPTDIVLRPIMMGLIVAGHVVPGGVKGGALALLILAGLTFSRYQLERLGSARRWEVIFEFFPRIILPFYAIVAVYELLTPNRAGLSTVLLVNNLWPDAGVVTMLPYWYIDVLFQCILFIVGLSWIGAVRRLATRSPWEFGICLLAACLALSALVDFLLPSWSSNHPFATHSWAYAFALGWVVGQAHSLVERIAAVSLTFACGWWFFGLADTHTIIATSAVAAIMLYPRVRLWRPLAHLVTFLAQATFFIYLCQGIAVNLVLIRLGMSSVTLNLSVAALLGSAAFVTWQSAYNGFARGRPWMWAASLRKRSA